MSNLYKIVDVNSNIIPFRMNPVQQALDDAFWWRNIILKSRQHGITTYACIRALDWALFTPNWRGGIIAHKREDAEEFFDLKIRFAYQQLPAWFREAIPVTKDTGGTIRFANNSQIYCSTSFRSGTLNYLHVSEFGPMAADYPEKAGEVITGALNTIHEKGVVTFESTAKGPSGPFYDMVRKARSLEAMIKAGNAKLTPMDYRFFFFSWFEDERNERDPDGVTVTPSDERYFNHIEAATGVELNARKRAWYVKKADEQGEKMKQEHPSTPDEAFEASIEGAYWGRQMADAEREGRICPLPVDPHQPVISFWDLGRNDTNSIWLCQRQGPWFNFIHYYENRDESLDHYVKMLHRISLQRHLPPYGTHYLPHDASVTDLSSLDNKSRQEILESLGLGRTEIVPRCDDVLVAIDQTRRFLARCRFDPRYCGEDRNGRGGIPALKNYRKKWNEQQQVFHDRPLHSWASNGADAFRQAAQAYQELPVEDGRSGKRSRARRRRAAMGWQVA